MQSTYKIRQQINKNRQNIMRQRLKMSLNLYCVGHLLLGMSPNLEVIAIPVRLLEETYFSFSGGYQVYTASSFSYRLWYSLLSVLGPRLVLSLSCCHGFCEFMCVGSAVFTSSCFFCVLQSFRLLTYFNFLFCRVP